MKIVKTTKYYVWVKINIITKSNKIEAQKYVIHVNGTVGNYVQYR